MKNLIIAGVSEIVVVFASFKKKIQICVNN